VAKAWHGKPKRMYRSITPTGKNRYGMFHDWVQGKAEVRFLRGRIRFSDPEGKQMAPAPFPSC